jgi:hypothetical protein
MAKPQRFSFPISAMLLAIAVIALFFTNGLSFMFLLLLTEVIAIYVCVEVLTRQLPPKLHSLSQANCYRLDGTRSHRRSSRERKALRKVRSDLWAAFLIVALVGTGGVYVIHSVIPLPLAGEVVSALRDDPTDFKGALRQRHVDDKYFHAVRSSSTSSNKEIRQQMQRLWMAWPVILVLAGATLVACLALIRYAYFRTLREFHDNAATRSTEYLNLDTGRLQG